jgi:hypothetical protein
MHAKHLDQRIDLDQISALSTLSTRASDNWQHERPWLEDITRYASVPRKSAAGCPKAQLTDAWVAAMVAEVMIVTIPRHAVRGHTRSFAVPEPAKNPPRWRSIRFTKDANDILGRETLRQDVTFPTKSEICGLVHRGASFIELDFKSYYDQFEYAPEVGSLFCFRHAGAFYRLNTLAMGQRQAVGIAAAATDVMTDFEHESTVKSIIDNVIFVAPSDDVVLRDASTFVERAHSVGATFNDVSSVTDLRARINTKGVWGGIELDLTSKTVALSKKTLDKTRFSWSNRGEWTWRQFAAHIGLLFWAHGIIDLPMRDFFPALRFVSFVGRLLTEHPNDWDSRAAVWPSVWPVLEQWTLLVLCNTPRVVPREHTEPPEWIVATDASLWGWGYFAVNNVSGETRAHGAPWSFATRRRFGARLGQSTCAEPQGIVNALCHLLDTKSPTRVVVLSDNTPAVAAYNAGYTHTMFDTNECLKRLHDFFGPRFEFRFGWIPGAMNPADPYSRSEAIAHEGVGLAAERLRQYVGSQGLVAHPQQ